MLFWNSLAFSMIHRMLAIWSLVPLPFLNPSWTSGSFLVYILLKPGLKDFEHYLVSMWKECNCMVVWAFFGIAFLGDWNENWPFPVLWPMLSFPIYWYIECSTFTASSFRIWNSSAGIPSPPLALFVVMLPKPTWLWTPGCLAIGEWSHHCGHLDYYDIFCIVLLCMFATSS